MKMMKKILLLFSLFFVTNVYAASSIEAKYDNFNVTEENFAKVRSDIGLKNAKISITGADSNYIKVGNYNNIGAEKTVYYYGPLTFSDVSSASATGYKNEINATIEFRWENGVILNDGNYADLLMTIDNIELFVTSDITNITSNGMYYSGLVYGDNHVELTSDFPKVSIASKIWDELTISEQLLVLTGSSIGNSYRVNIKIVKPGTNTPIDSKYKNMTFGAYDLDIRDKTVVVDDPTTNINSIKEQYRGYYVEGLELMSGVNSTVHMASNNPISNNLREQSVITYNPNGPHGGLKIYADGEKFTNTAIRSATRDSGTYYSGFITSVSPQGFTFYWTGSDCGTTLFSVNDFAINERHNYGGTVGTTSYGKDVNLTKVDEWETTNHAIGSRPIYTYQPLIGYHVVNVRVYSTDVTIKDDFKYQFTNLSYNPLVKLDSDGNKLVDSNGNYVQFQQNPSIEITYEPNAFTIIYENGGGTDGVEKMPDEVRKYNDDLTISKNEYKKNNNEFGGWKATIEDANGNQVILKDDKGKDLIIADKGTLQGLDIPNNGKVILTAQWISNPNTGINNVNIIISIVSLIILSGVYFLYRRRNYFAKI